MNRLDRLEAHSVYILREAYKQSQPLAMSPQDGRAFSCWFPMPFADGARITLENESDIPCPAFYFYVDYEAYESLDDGLGRFGGQ